MVKAIARRSATALLGIVDGFVQKRPRRLVLGSDHGVKYNGNPRYLFEALAADPRWDVYWLTVSPELHRQINQRFPGRALRAWSLRALWMGLTAHWLGFSHSRYDLGPFAYLRRPRFIYLNHGVPLKTMGYDKAYRDPATANAALGMGAVTCCSEFEAALWCRAFGLPMERMWVTGVPRNDQLFVRDEALLHRLGVLPGRRVLLFAPTYRESGLLQNYLPVPGLDPHALVRLLERHNSVMLIRPHYYEWAAAKAMLDELGSDFIRAADEGLVPEVNELLPLVDVLITDYSSIAFDFLLLDRPMIFSCYDRETYQRERGFSIDYEANTPGEKVVTPAEFLGALETVLSGQDPHCEFRHAIRRKFHAFADGKSAQRVALRIEQLLEGRAQTQAEQRQPAAIAPVSSPTVERAKEPIGLEP